MNLILIAFNCVLISFCTNKVLSLECYACKDQENNKDKCVETVKTCDVGQDRCLTEIRWGSTRYWAPSGEKQYYISKTCTSKEVCEQLQQKYLTRCDRIWYNDWECVECCTGDRCNYFVTLHASATYPSIIFILLSTMAALILTR